MSQQPQGWMNAFAGGLKPKASVRVDDVHRLALARAEQAMQGLADHFDQWMQDELSRLNAARVHIRIQGYSAETADSLYACAYDLKGLAATYGYPVVSLLAAALCRLTDDPATRLKTPLFLLDAHIASIKAAVHAGVLDVDDPVARTLLAELQTCMSAYERTALEAERFRSMGDRVCS